jgi:predicted ATP-grasp superfamily ATP-dependent carboligase
MSASRPPVLVLQPSNGGLAFARALGRRGIDVEILATEGDRHAARTRYATGRVMPGFAADPEVWLAALRAHSGDGPVAVVAGADEATEFLSRHRDDLPPDLLTFERLDDVHLALMDKTSSYEMAVAAGVRAPWTRHVASADDLERVVEQAPYPCVLKPVLTHLWRPIFGHDRVLLAHKGHELRAHGERALGAGLETIVSEYIPGGDDCVEEAILLRAPDGSFPMQYGCQKLRQSPPGFGAASLCVSAPMPESLEMARKLLEGAGFVGVAGIETKRHAGTGDYYFIEANVRLPTQFGLGDAAGAEASWRTYATLAGQPLGPVPTPRAGVRLVFPELEAIELRRLVRGARDGVPPTTFGDFVRGWRGVRELGVLDLRDPGPGLAIVGRSLRKRLDRRLRTTRSP